MRHIWDMEKLSKTNTGAISGNYLAPQIKNNVQYGQVIIMGKLHSHVAKKQPTKSAQRNRKRSERGNVECWEIM